MEEQVRVKLDTILVHFINAAKGLKMIEAGQGHAGITFCKNYLTISIKELEKLLKVSKEGNIYKRIREIVGDG